MNDLYLRTYSQVYLVKLDSLVKKGNSLSDEEKVLLQTTLDKAVNGGQLAVAYNPKNYLNFEALGGVYQVASLIGVKDANSKIIDSYKLASDLNPGNPRLKLIIANTHLALDKKKEAKEYAEAALALKPDYIDALITLSRIAKSDGNNAEALSYAQRALALSPSNENLIKYVNSLKNSSDTTENNKDKNQ